MEPGADMGLVFEWFCKQKNKDEERMESFPENLKDCDPVTYPSTPDIATTNKSLSRDHFKGCFGTGGGKLSDSGTTSIQFGTGVFIADFIYLC